MELVARAGTWLKPRAMTRAERIVSFPLGFVVFLIIFMFFGCPPLRVVPVWGPSMQPTMAVWSLPAPLERLSFSGWVHYDPTLEVQEGSIVYFRVPHTRFYEVKRVARIDPEKGLWVVPDNQGVSGEGSDNSDLYDWIPWNCILGVVDGIYTPQTLIRSLSEEGRFFNWAAINIGPLEKARTVEIGEGLFVSNFPAGTWALYSKEGVVVSSGVGIATAGEDMIAVANNDNVEIIDLKGRVISSCPFKSEEDAFLYVRGVVAADGGFYVLGKKHIWRIDGHKKYIVGLTLPESNMLFIKDNILYQGNKLDLGMAPDEEVLKEVVRLSPLVAEKFGVN